MGRIELSLLLDYCPKYLRTGGEKKVPYSVLINNEHVNEFIILNSVIICVAHC